MIIQDWINNPNTAVENQDLKLLCQKQTILNNSPIDEFYTKMEEYKLLLFGDGLETLNKYPFLYQLILVGFISATENYFRNIFASIIEICPMAQEAIIEKSITLGSALWHQNSMFIRGIFENKSFADASEINKVIKEFLAMPNLPPPCNEILSNYENICQLRHAVVHSNNYIAGKNAIKLKFQPCESDKFLIFSPSCLNLQDIYIICRNIVCETNRHLFQQMSLRFAKHWPSLISTWDPTVEIEMFNKIWKMFYSTIDNITIKNPSEAMNEIKSLYNP